MYTRYVIRTGDIGIGVNKIQAYLNILVDYNVIRTKVDTDGKYGSKTATSVSEFQRAVNLNADGIVGSNTWDALINKLKQLGVITNIPVFSNSYFLTIGSTGLDVFKMQEYLNAIATSTKCLNPIPVDGSYGNKTSTMVRQYQYMKNLTIDGAIGAKTWDAIINDYLKM